MRVFHMLVVVYFGLFFWYMYAIYVANLKPKSLTQSVMLAYLNNFCQVNRLYCRQLSVALFHSLMKTAIENVKNNKKKTSKNKFKKTSKKNTAI